MLEKAPAKINLGLDTSLRYPDGSPKWDMVMTSVDLADYVSVQTVPNSNKVSVATDSGFFYLMINVIWHTKLYIF